MKTFDLDGIPYLRQLREGPADWYYALGSPDGDLYEAEEIFRAGAHTEGYAFFLVRYPEGTVVRPLEKRPDVAVGEPVWCDGWICFPAVDFPAGMIRVYRFDPQTGGLEEAAALPLSSVKDCYNLRLHARPLTLTRQPNDGAFELLWPERRTLQIDPRESFFHREGSRLFFSTWYEDPTYRVETVIRDAETGEILDRLPGDVHIMPNGELWHLRG